MVSYDNWERDDFIIKQINKSLKETYGMRNGIIKDQVYYRLLNKADKVQNFYKRDKIKEKINKALEES